MFGINRKPDLNDTLFGAQAAEPWRFECEATPQVPVVAWSDLPGYQHKLHDGEKFPGGMGPVNILTADYWTLRARSSELFETNLYARGLIRRMTTNEINTGLHLEATPIERLLFGKKDDQLAEWTEDVEDRFGIWAKDPYLCDHYERQTFGALQQQARIEALVAGDVLVVLRQDQRTGLPRIQLISGSAVQTPFGHQNSPTKNKITHGVELDAQGRHVGFWVQQPDGTSKRLPAYGEKSGRRLAWLLYGTDKRLDDVRGKPILSLVLQSLKEIDRYRDSTQRKAVLLSMLAMFVSKAEDKPGTRSLTGRGAVRRGTERTIDTTGTERTFRVAEHIPGLIVDELQVGEKPEAFTTNQTVETYGTFEEAIIQAVAWGNGVPPEIYRLSFTKNYSASQAATAEYKLELNMLRTTFGDGFCTPCYEEWLLAQTLTGKITAQGLLESWRDSKQYDIYGAWVACDWAGQIKPAIDLPKLVNGTVMMCENGFETRDRATRELTGTKFSKNVQQLKRENELLAEAQRPLLELQAKIKALLSPAPETIDTTGEDVDEEDDDEEDDTDADERKAS